MPAYGNPTRLIGAQTLSKKVMRTFICILTVIRVEGMWSLMGDLHTIRDLTNTLHG